VEERERYGKESIGDREGLAVREVDVGAVLMCAYTRTSLVSLHTFLRKVVRLSPAW
jgi:hypothetical protein